jgi:hypothetical protein
MHGEILGQQKTIDESGNSKKLEKSRNKKP